MISRRRLTYQTAILGSSRCTPSIPRVPGLPDFRGSPLFMLHRSQRTTKFGMVTHGEGCVSGDASLHLHKCVARFVSDAEFLVCFAFWIIAGKNTFFAVAKCQPYWRPTNFFLSVSANFILGQQHVYSFTYFVIETLYIHLYRKCVKFGSLCLKCWNCVLVFLLVIRIVDVHRS